MINNLLSQDVASYRCQSFHKQIAAISLPHWRA